MSAAGGAGSSSATGVAVSLKDAMFSPLQEHHVGRHRKITIIGAAGAVGLACAYAILNQGLASELALVDVAEEKLKGECADLQHGSAFARRCIIKASSDYAISKNSTLIIITAGARQREGESRLDLVGRNLAIFKGFVPQLVTYSPDAVFCVVSNPVDIMTYVTWRLTGLPVGRVFGSGTALDSSRFRVLLAERLGVDPRSVHGMILGEHGDSSVACWSSLAVGGVSVKSLKPEIGTASDPEDYESVHRGVINAAYEIIKAKGYTNWAIGMTVANLAEAVLRNEHRVVPLSVPVGDRYGITEKDVYLSLPAVLGSEGVTEVLNMRLEADEVAKLQKSAEAIGKVQAGLDWAGYTPPSVIIPAETKGRTSEPPTPAASASS